MPPYTFLNAGLPIQKQPKDALTSDFQTALDLDFKTASDWFTIQRETSHGSGLYSNIDVRVNRLFDGKTTVSVGDDYKRILFKNSSYNPQLGSLFFFDNNYWIVINLEAIKSLGTTCVVRRCNNTLRWRDDNTGRTYSEPCIIDYLIKESRDYSTGGSALVQPSGFVEVIIQYNSRTNLIRPSKRFLFGNPNNWIGYKLMGGGLHNFDNRYTNNNTSGGLIRLSMLSNQTNETTDDLVNGIADVGEYIYSLSLNENTLSLNISDNFKLIPTLEINNIAETGETYTWTSSDITKATVNSSGIVTGVAVGACTITCSLTNNSSVSDSCVFTIVNTPTSNYSIVMTPNTDFIYEGSEQIFTTNLYLNNVLQPDTFTYTLNQNGVSINNFRYNVLSGNTFWIKNLKRDFDNELIVTATTGSHSMAIPIKLIGAW